MLSEIKVADSSNTTNVTEYNESTEDSNSANNFDYSSNFLIKLEEIEKTDGFGSAYTSNLSNLYRGRISSYYTKEQYNTIIEKIDEFGEFNEWHQYSETDVSLFNKLTYKNENIQDDKILTPCNIETVSDKEVKGVISRDIISCNRTDKSLSCKVSSGDTEVSLVLMMPLDESTSLDEYIDSMTPDEFRGVIIWIWVRTLV